MFISKKLDLVIENSDVFKSLLPLSEQFEICSFYGTNKLNLDKYSKYDWLIALDSIESCRPTNNKKTNLTATKEFFDSNSKEWIFAALSYDFKNGIEDLESNNSDNLFFDDYFFYVPKYVITSANGEIVLHHHSSVENIELADFENMIHNSPLSNLNINHNINGFKHRISHDKYIETIGNIRKDIKYGDIYEMNFCQEFYVENAEIEKPWVVYQKMCELSPAPFSAFYKNKDKYLISASPERYMQRTDNKIVSQPIKGTAKRQNNEIDDKKLATSLQNSIKERAENVMIVDLVRNDLSRIPNSKNTKVEELCEIYSFKHVHQMISTISVEIENNTDFSEILKATFPMGSMTGAPKISSMQLIEKYEEMKRGLFSGSVGYIKPNGDFDFNVIIRSLLYNSSNKYLSLSTGGAITYLCNAEDEYQESLLKADAVFRLF